MKTSDAKQGMYVRAIRAGCINGAEYVTGDIGYIYKISVGGAPSVRRITDDVVLGPVDLRNWEPYEPAPPVPVLPANTFLAKWAACPECGAELRFVDLDFERVRWLCGSSLYDKEFEQTAACQISCGKRATETLTRLRELLLKTDSLASMKRDLRVQVLGILRPADKMADLYEEYPCLADD